MKIVFSVAAAICALIAAALWLKSSVVLIKPTDKLDSSGLAPFRIIREEGKKTWDVLATAEAQTKWNKRAAFAAFLSAIFQAAALMMQDSK